MGEPGRAQPSLSSAPAPASGLLTRAARGCSEPTSHRPLPRAARQEFEASRSGCDEKEPQREKCLRSGGGRRGKGRPRGDAPLGGRRGAGSGEPGAGRTEPAAERGGGRALQCRGRAGARRGAPRRGGRRATGPQGRDAAAAAPLTFRAEEEEEGEEKGLRESWGGCRVGCRRPAPRSLPGRPGRGARRGAAAHVRRGRGARSRAPARGRGGRRPAGRPSPGKM